MKGADSNDAAAVTSSALAAVARAQTEDSIGARDLTAIRRTLGLILLVSLTIAVYFAKELILPLLIGIILALTLSTPVRWLRRHGLPPVVAATALILVAGTLFVGSALLVAGPVSGWISEAPKIGAEIKVKLRSLASSVAVVQEASDRVEEIAVGTDPTVQKVALQTPGLLTVAVSNVMGVIATASVALFLALFLLASGDMFYLKLIDVFPRFGDKKRALRILYGIQESISRYLLTVIVINAVLAAVIGIGLWAIGMPQPLILALVAFLLNFLPFIGALLGTGLVAAVAIVSFDQLGHAALAPAIYIVASAVEGQFITPVILGRRLELNLVSVFVTVVFWGWLWGVAGVLMAVPFLVCLKVMCDHLEQLHSLGSFLSAASPASATEKTQ
jgi:predicted PurR-regulated permease PerM